MKLNFLSGAFSPTSGRSSSQESKTRPIHLLFLKYGLLVTIVAAFIASAVLLGYGTDIVEGHVRQDRTPGQVECIKKTWIVFLSMNLVFCLMGFIGVALEQICCAFFFSMYSFFVSFGAFFDTVSDNHWFLIICVPITLASLIFVVVMRIERLDPPLPPRKYSIYSASFTRA
jgi:hypothetical protein